MLISIPVDHILNTAIIFCRISAAIMIMPGMNYVSAYFKILFSILISLSIGNVINFDVSNESEIYIHIVQEIIIGTIIGIIIRSVMYITQIVGSIISANAGLSMGSMLDPNFSENNTYISQFLTLSSVAIIFISDVYKLIIKYISHNFEVMSWENNASLIEYAMKILIQSMNFGIIISMISIGIFLISNIIFGLTNKIIPNMQIFFISIPVNIVMQMSLLIITSATIISLCIEKYQEILLST